MADVDVLEWLRERLQTELQTGSLWSVLDELAKYDETKLSAILRPYDEGGFLAQRDKDNIQLRRQLDKALDVLTNVEIAYEIGVLPYQPGAPEDDEESVPRAIQLRRGKELENLVDTSGAFGRYASAYGYYGVRMLARRWFGPSWEHFDLSGEKNRRAFTLAVPPSFDLQDDAAEYFARFLRLTPEKEAAWNAAMRFLDGLPPENQRFGNGANASEWAQRQSFADQYQLWLKGIPVGDEGKDQEVLHKRFVEITEGIRSWVENRVTFYRRISKSEFEDPCRPGAEDAEAAICNPLVARFALADLYWIAQILRADVSADAAVRYAHSSWLNLMRLRNIFDNSLREDGNCVLLLEDNLRAVFNFVCDLIQNSVEITQCEQACNAEAAAKGEKDRKRQDARAAEKDGNALVRRWRSVFGVGSNPLVTCWRAVFDTELRMIDRQREDRAVASPVFRGEKVPLTEGIDRKAYWSEWLKTGRRPHHRVGLAISGGGVRSASFNLGVLQGLQEFDQLRYLDYLSTVSGGGFIGAWLAVNVKRAKQWLGRSTCWDESITHLRAYSSYLAPKTGILSPDTWTLVLSWLRNAFLIQLTTLTWMLVLLLVGWIGREVFLALAAALSYRTCVCHQVVYGALLAAVGVSILVTLWRNFHDSNDIKAQTGKGAPSAGTDRLFAVSPAWIGGFLLASQLWSIATEWPVLQGSHDYSYLLQYAWCEIVGFLIFYFAALFVLAWLSLRRSDSSRKNDDVSLRDKMKTRMGRGVGSLLIASASVGLLYLSLCGILYLYLWMAQQPNAARVGSYVYVFGPGLVLMACTLSIVFLIGFSGRYSNEAQREWWIRFGTWLLIYAAAGLALSFAAVFGPRLMVRLFGVGSASSKTLKWSAVVSWLGTVVGGLLAGNSSKTSGTPTNGSNKVLLELLARLGGLLFIVGAVLGAAAVLYFLVLNIVTPYTYKDPLYWAVFDAAFFPDLWGKFAVCCLVAVICGFVFSWLFDINIFGLSQLYRNRLVRCYLGATRWMPGLRSPQPFTKFDFKDDLALSELKEEYRGPFPIFNCTLNLSGSSDLTLHSRHSASFSLTPLFCGSDRPGMGYAPTDDGSKERSFANGVQVGQAVAVSGAAASPNMGYNTSPLAAMLLTLFNVRLGWWFPNPARKRWNARGLRSSLYYLTRELLGSADETRNFVNVSDGGHFENLGIYELIRRRCKVIIASDAECDELLEFAALGNLVRICATDFGAQIDLDVRSIQKQENGHSLAHSAVGIIKYSNGGIGYLIYLKASITGDEEIGIAQYRAAHPSFPHETTANQFFAEDQFEAYRKLGRHIVTQCLRGHEAGSPPLEMARTLAETMAPARSTEGAFLKHSKALERLWEKCGRSPALHSYIDDLMGIQPPIARAPEEGKDSHQESKELCMTLQMVQLMEDVFLDLQLDDTWEHPDNRGWAILFMRWARSPRFRKYWRQIHRAFGIRFECFCAARLGLPVDKRVVKV